METILEYICGGYIKFPMYLLGCAILLAVFLGTYALLMIIIRYTLALFTRKKALEVKNSKTVRVIRWVLAAYLLIGLIPSIVYLYSWVKW